MEDDGMDHWDSSLNISSLREDYSAGIKPEHVVEAIYERIEAYKEIQPSVWIHLQPKEEVLRAAKELCERWRNSEANTSAPRPPLWGIPFSVKDNIDIADVPTTNGCPALTFTPSSSATVYRKCVDAGGLFIGKTNMEQLATGLTGCRSPYGQLHSTWSKTHVPGGSSSGSAVTVSEGLVSFSLGTDTAGSIRVPAIFNGVVGFKPTKGTVSARGVTPACLHQDTVGFLALNVEDAETVWRVCKGFDKGDIFAKRGFEIIPPSPAYEMPTHSIRSRFGIPPNSALEICCPEYRKSFARVAMVIQNENRKLVELDWAPFAAANELLYNGSFVLERLTIFPEGWFETAKQTMHPITRQVFEGAQSRGTSAVEVFRDLHKQAAYKSEVEDMLAFEKADDVPWEDRRVLTVMIVPTTSFHPMIAEVEKDPISIGGKMGMFTHFANVLDLVGIAVPCGSYTVDDGKGGRTRLPFGVTVLARAGLEEELLLFTKQLEGVFANLDEED